MPDDKEAFRKAIENDEYAEYELPNGDTLVTDHESTGVFHPYVVPTGERKDHATDDLQAVSDALVEVEYELGFRSTGIEYDVTNDVFYVYAERIDD